MDLRFLVIKSGDMTVVQRNEFLTLLKLQGQVSNPTMDKINKCVYVSIAYQDNNPIGIGAIKQVYKVPFDKATVSKLKKQFEHELGYIYVKSDEASPLRGLGIGKMISKLLVNRIYNKNVFATTEYSSKNPMVHILNGIGFTQFGIPYTGDKTGKNIALFLKFKL